MTNIPLTLKQQKAAAEVFERWRGEFDHLVADDWPVLASVIANLMAAFAVCLCDTDGRIDVVENLNILCSTAFHTVERMPEDSRKVH